MANTFSFAPETTFEVIDGEFDGIQLSFDVTNFVQNLVNNSESLAGIGLRALEFGGVAIDPTSLSMPRLIIETAVIINLATDDIVATSQNTTIAIPVANLLANDININSSNALTITAVNNAINGTASLNDNNTQDDFSDDTIIFIPNQDFSGNASFEYTISDNQDADDIGLVTVIIPTNINGTNADDNLVGTDNQDIMRGFMGNDSLEGFAGDDFLDGGKGEDKLSGGIGDDGMYGGTENDILNGDQGNDFLNGGPGTDTLTGGTGADSFYLDGNSSTKEIITDFNLGEGDKIITFNNLLFRDLSFAGNDILFGDTVLATLQGFDTTSLNSTHFNAI